MLLVEDDELVRTYASRQLAALGYRVLVASRGEEALGILHSEQAVDLLFTDVIMPGMSGVQLAAQARALRPGLAVLYASGYTGDALAYHCAPDAHLLNKPYRPRELADEVRRTLDARARS